MAVVVAVVVAVAVAVGGAVAAAAVVTVAGAAAGACLRCCCCGRLAHFVLGFGAGVRRARAVRARGVLRRERPPFSRPDRADGGGTSNPE